MNGALLTTMGRALASVANSDQDPNRTGAPRARLGRRRGRASGRATCSSARERLVYLQVYDHRREPRRLVPGLAGARHVAGRPEEGLRQLLAVPRFVAAPTRRAPKRSASGYAAASPQAPPGGFSITADPFDALASMASVLARPARAVKQQGRAAENRRVRTSKSQKNWCYGVQFRAISATARSACCYDATRFRRVFAGSRECEQACPAPPAPALTRHDWPSRPRSAPETRAVVEPRPPGAPKCLDRVSTRNRGPQLTSR